MGRFWGRDDRLDRLEAIDRITPGSAMSDEQLPPTHQPFGGQNPYGQPAYGMGGDGSTVDDRNWGSAAHWGSFVSAFVALAFLAPLLVLLLKGPQSAFVRRHAVESLNFQISMLIYGTVGAFVAVILAFITFGLALLIIIPAALALCALWVITVIQGSIKAGQGLDYHYPLTIRFVS
jgi:uncharacterized Tic20 family protein